MVVHDGSVQCLGMVPWTGVLDHVRTGVLVMDWSTEPYGLVNGALRTSLKVVMHGVTSLKVVMHGVSLKMHERVGHGAKDVHFWFYRAL